MVSVSVRQNRPEPVERNPHSYPHPDNPGLIEQLDGYYDWAGRRLFLVDGSPDPGTPGAYRYQTRPDLCDLEAPDSDPASPRYEPPHLRHRPGDTWEIGGKPHDPDDPGPYGTPGWFQDRRTGRHRRNELPDLIPPWEQDTEPRPESQTRPSPHGRGRRFRAEHEPDEPYRFSKLREDAWDDWLVDSEPLAAAHHRAFSSAEGGPLIAAVVRLFRWIIAVLKGASAEPHRPETEDSVGLRHVPPNRPSPHPQSETPYILQWERRFDTCHPAIGGAAL